MAVDDSSDDGCPMPVRTIENSPPLIRPWVRRMLVYLLLPTVVIASLVEVLAISWATSGYWGPEWPTAGRDTVVISMIWVGLVAAFVLTVQRPIRLMWRGWRRESVGGDRVSPREVREISTDDGSG